MAKFVIVLACGAIGLAIGGFLGGAIIGGIALAGMVVFA